MLTAEDRYYIERKYHDPQKEFNPFNRMAYHGIGYDEATGLDDEGILQGLCALKEETNCLSHPVQRAKAIEFVLRSERLYVNEHDYFIGLYSLNRLANTTTFAPWRKQSDAIRDPKIVQLSDDFNASGAVMIWPDYDHVVPDWKSLMELGFTGIRDRAREYGARFAEKNELDEKRAAYFEAIEIQYGAIIEMIKRAQALAESKTHAKAKEIAACLKSLSSGKPNTFYEALQLIYIYFIVSESVDSFQVRSLGNGLDGTLYPFYKKGIESGELTEEKARELLAYFLMQWSAIGNYWGQPFYLGGTNKDGASKYNELSAMILDVYDELGIYNPKIQLKINENTPDWLLNKSLDMIRKKNASIVFCCEPAMIKAIMGYGATYDEALEFDVRGCYETGVRANEVSSSSGYVNAAKAVEYVFTSGYDQGLGKQVGAITPPVAELVSFEDFYSAFLEQWRFLIEESMKISNDFERFFAFVNPSTMYSATIETSLRRGADGYAGAVKYNNGAVLCCAFASAVDSLMAVRELVYNRKEISLCELAVALKNNWVGYENLRLKAKRLAGKYGTGDAVTDSYASAMASYFASLVNNKPNVRGGVYKAIMHSARAFIIQGEKTGALPDGRRAGEELSKNASPVAGMDKKGVTALIRSATRLNPSDFHESFCVDLMLAPSSVKGEDGLTAMKSLLKTYLTLGGQSIQFNVFDGETLRDAQKNPEKYAGLQVRVCGWNVLWNNMSKAEQDAYILRAER